MKSRGKRLALLVCAALVATLGHAGPGRAAEQAVVETGQGGDGRWLQVTLPGPVISGLVMEDGGQAVVLLLVGPMGEMDGPRSIYRLDAGDAAQPARVALLRAGLPGYAKAMAAMDLDADGRPEILLGGLGTLDSLGPLSALAAGAPPRRLLSHPGFDLRSLSPDRLRVSGSGESWIGAVETGALRVYRANGQGGITRVVERSIPIIAERQRSGLRLSSPPPRVALEGDRGSEAEVPTFAAGPTAQGKRRLRTELLVPGEESQEAWSLLPGPERVEQSWVRRIDGRIVLFVGTQSADKLGIFETRKIRGFSLGADRTRAGRGPMFTHETDARRWFGIELDVVSLGGDDKDDLVLSYLEGLGGGELVLEAFEGLGGGRFLRKPRRSKLDPAPGSWVYGPDLTGDGVPDLISLTGAGHYGAASGPVQVHAGEAKGRRVVEKSPRWTVPSPPPKEDAEGQTVSTTVSVGSQGTSVSQEEGEEGSDDEEGKVGPKLFRSELLTADLTGDGRPELLRLADGEQGEGVVQLWYFSPGGIR